MYINRPSDSIAQSGIKRTKYYDEQLRGLRTPFRKLCVGARASGKPAFEDDLENQGVAAGLSAAQRCGLVKLLIAASSEVLDEAEIRERGRHFIRAAVKANSSKAAA